MERRQDERIETNVLLTCRVPARPVRAVMRDLSHTGCRLELPDAHVELGGTALVDLPGAGRVAGRVAWVRGRHCGIQFERAVRGRSAVAVGLEEPASEPVAPEQVEADEGPSLPGLLRHWIRRLTGRPG
jgi:hypothetical protein